MESTFEFIRADSRTLVILFCLVAWPLLLVPFLGYLAYGPMTGSATLTDNGVVLKYPFYGRTLNYNELKVEEAGPLDLTAHPDKSLKRRTNGISLPGYNSGWFRLKNGEKALVFVSRWKNVVEIPTTNGFHIYISLEKPAEFLQSLKDKVGM